MFSSLPLPVSSRSQYKASNAKLGLGILIILSSLIAISFLVSGSSSETDTRVHDDKGSILVDPDTENAILNLKSGVPAYQPSAQKENPENWSDNREFGIVIDAGSSGSRVYVYSWKLPAAQSMNSGKLPIIEKGDKEGKNWMLKSKPGISTFADKPSKIGLHLDPLLKFAADAIPESRHSKTPIYLFATAGLRLVEADARQKILDSACHHVKTHYHFQLFGSCQRHFRMISGELEGIFGWLSVNYMLGGISDSELSRRTFAFLDMGGASTQIAFEPTEILAKEHDDHDDLSQIKIRFLNGKESKFDIFVTTFLGYGVNEARRRYLDILVQEFHQGGHNVDVPARINSSIPASSNSTKLKGISYDSSAPVSFPSKSPKLVDIPDNTLTFSHSNSSNIDFGQDQTVNKTKRFDKADDMTVIPDPCLPESLSLQEPKYFPSNYTFIGTGQFDRCMQKQFQLLNKTVQCSKEPCLFNGVHAPIQDFTKHSFVGVSEYWYTFTEFLNEDKDLTFKKLHEMSQDLCSKPWKELQTMYQNNEFPKVSDLSDLNHKCFKSAWMINVLYNGIGIPKTESLAQSRFQILDEYQGFPVSWTLGAILMHVSESISSLVTAAYAKQSSGEDSSFASSVFTFFVFIIGSTILGFAIFVFIKRKHLKRISRRRYVGVRPEDDGLFGAQSSASVSIPMQDFNEDITKRE